MDHKSKYKHYTTAITLLGESIGVNLCDSGSAMVSVTIKVQKQQQN